MGDVETDIQLESMESSLDELSKNEIDFDLDNLNVSFYTNATGQWNVIGLNKNATNFNYNQSNSFFDSYSTKYWWSVNCTDYYDWINSTYQFRTVANKPPLTSNEIPSNESISVLLNK